MPKAHVSLGEAQRQRSALLGPQQRAVDVCRELPQAVRATMGLAQQGEDVFRAKQRQVAPGAQGPRQVAAVTQEVRPVGGALGVAPLDSEIPLSITPLSERQSQCLA